MSPSPIRAQFTANDFVISAGCVLLKRSLGSSYSLIYISKPKLGHNLFPKGRKDISETIEETAVRETFEETGYKCSLLPLAIPSLAPNASNHPINVEPIGISLRVDRMSKPGQTCQKIIYWFVGMVLENEAKRELGTQMAYEMYEVKEVPLEEAEEVMTFDEDKELISLVRNLVKSISV